MYEFWEDTVSPVAPHKSCDCGETFSQNLQQVSGNLQAKIHRSREKPVNTLNVKLCM